MSFVDEVMQSVSRDCLGIVIRYLKELEGLDEISKDHKRKLTKVIRQMDLRAVPQSWQYLKLKSNFEPLIYLDHYAHVSMEDKYPEIKAYKKCEDKYYSNRYVGRRAEDWVKFKNGVWEGYSFIVDNHTGVLYKQKVMIKLGRLCLASHHLHFVQNLMSSVATDLRYINGVKHTVVCNCASYSVHLFHE